jgi:hypothetical protein
MYVCMYVYPYIGLYYILLRACNFLMRLIYAYILDHFVYKIFHLQQGGAIPVTGREGHRVVRRRGSHIF